MQDIIHKVVKDNWLTTAADLAGLSISEMQQMGVPGALGKAVLGVLSGSSGVLGQSQAPARAITWLVKTGHLFQGKLYAAGQRGKEVAVFVNSVCEDAELQASCNLRAKVCVAGKEMTVWDATGRCFLDAENRQALELQPVEMVQGTTEPPLRMVGKFDLRYQKKPRLGGKLSTAELGKPGSWLCKTSTFTSFELELRSTAAERGIASPSEAEAAVIDKLQDVQKDTSVVTALVRELEVALQPYAESSVPVVGKWLQRLKNLSDDKEVSLPKAMLTGATGSGKSYLNNAILGYVGLVPSDCSTGRAVSSANVRCQHRSWSASMQDGPGEWLLKLLSGSSEISSPEDSVNHKRFGAEIQLLTQDEWTNECSDYAATICHFWLEERFEKRIQKKRPTDTDSGASEAWDKLVAVYSYGLLTRGKSKSWASAEELLKHLAQLNESSKIVKKLGKPISHECNDVEGFSTYIQSYVRSDSADPSYTNYWPVVKDILIKGPFERLRGFAHMMDCVGCGDSNTARDTLTKQHERESDVVFIVSDIARCVSNNVTIELLKTQLRSILLRCSQSDLAFVCTKADVITEREAQCTLRLHDEASFRDCVVARNKLVRKNMQKEIRQMMCDMQREEEDSTFSWLKFPVFCISAKAYMTVLGAEKPSAGLDELDLRDTEVPDLVRLLQMQALRHGNRASQGVSTRLVEAASLICSFLGNGDTVEEHKTLCKTTFSEQCQIFQQALKRKLDKFMRDAEVLFSEGLLKSIREGSRLAGLGAPKVAEAWHGYHPTSYCAAARKSGINPKSRRGEIHWPRELSKGCYDAFQPKWMELFGSQLPKLYESFEQILREEMRGFHEHMAQKLPQIPNLEDIQASVEIEGYLQRVRISSEEEEQMTKRELCEEVIRNVQFNLKSTFEDAKDIKGKGCFARMKEHIDGSVQNIKWQEVTQGLLQGCEEFLYTFQQLNEKATRDLPQLLEDGYEVLWHDLDEAALRAWRDLREAVLPTALQIKAKAEALKARVEERAQLSADGTVIVDDGEDEEDRESVQDAAGMKDEHAEDGEEEHMSEDAEEVEEEEQTTHHAREEEMSDGWEKMEEENAEDSEEQEEPEESRQEKIEPVTPHGAEASETQSNHEEEGAESAESQGLEEEHSDKGMKRKREDSPHAVRNTPTPLAIFRRLTG
ncbi:NUGGC [Symbiodinium sp. CCMP2592]|nr:NUGGC [Symbiodinium sp. CCMP2592]